MFDHDHGIAEIAQARQRLQQAFVVALVQADAGFVEHVHHADQAGADLRGQADALRLAAGQGLGRTRQHQVVQAHVVEKAQARRDFLDDLVGDLALVAGQVQRAEPVLGLADRQPRQRRQGLFGDEHVARGAVQAIAVAGRAGLVRAVLGQFLAHGVGFGLTVAPLQIGNDAFETVRARGLAAAFVRVAEGDLVAAAAV